MANCIFCKAQTELDDNGVPICLNCSDAGPKRKPPATDQQIRSTLLQDILELTARVNEAAREFEAIIGQVPSRLPHPDGVQRIKNASNKLSTARQELMKAHRRLDDHFGSEIIRKI
jgi:phytoene dehydrogenase-like protein